MQGGQEIHIQLNINNEHYNCTKLTVIIHDTDFTIDHWLLALFSRDYSFYTIRLNLKHLMHSDYVRFISMHVSFSGLKEDMVKINNYNFPDWVIYIEWDLTIDFFLYSRDKIPHHSHIILAAEIFPCFNLLLCINGIMLYHNSLCNQIYGRKPGE